MKTKILWLVFLIYIVLSGYTIDHHELWGDEVHSWNITKGSDSYSSLITNTRYEGHPPGWYTILWPVTRLTHNPVYMQIVHWTIACLVVGMTLFLSPFPPLTRILIPFGYYFLYEYSILSRNYAIGIFPALCLCYIIRRDFKYKLLLYYGLLFWLSNSHLLGLILAGSLHLYFLLLKQECGKRSPGIFALHLLLGALIFLPAIYFIFPPADSELNMHFWLSRWSTHQLIALGKVPLLAFLPVPAWWIYNFWNTEFVWELKNSYHLLQFIIPVISLALLAVASFILLKNKKTLILFLANVLVSFIVAGAVHPLTDARYAGFIFIGFITAYWLYCYESTPSRQHARLVDLLLGVQVIAGAFAVFQDIRRPFSNQYMVNELITEVPAGSKIITDIWSMEGIAAFTDKPAYCADLEKEQYFIIWSGDVAAMRTDPFRYTGGIKKIFLKEGINKVYMITQDPPWALFEADPKLSGSFHVTLMDKKEGAIEKGSNLYLYAISGL